MRIQSIQTKPNLYKCPYNAKNKPQISPNFEGKLLSKRNLSMASIATILSAELALFISIFMRLGIIIQVGALGLGWLASALAKKAENTVEDPITLEKNICFKPVKNIDEAKKFAKDKFKIK